MKKFVLIIVLSLSLFAQGCSLLHMALSAAAAYGVSRAFE